MNAIFRGFCLGVLFSLSISPVFATGSGSTKPLPGVDPASTTKVMGVVKIQFDYKVSGVAAMGIAPSTPSSWRSFVPVCPAGTTWVGGVNPNTLPQKDFAPNYPYCNCFCKGSCGALNALTGGISGSGYSYSASVTCSAQLEGWFPSGVFSSVGNNAGQIPDYSTPGQYYYCMVGNCSTNPLPASIGYTVPTGGWQFQNTKALDYLNCSTLYSGSNPYGAGKCGAPSP